MAQVTRIHLSEGGFTVEKKVRLRQEPAFAQAHALLMALSDPAGPVRHDMSRRLLSHALDELNGVLQGPGHTPHEPVEVSFAGPDAGLRQVDEALEQLLIWSADLGDALRVVRALELAGQASRELKYLGERV